MSGIAGIIGSEASVETVSGMIERIRHRGPDGEWVHQLRGCALGACESKLGAKNRPAHARAGDVVLLFDGEIYNDREDGVSDAEVALREYLRAGTLFVRNLRGAFACAVWDGDDLILTRDPVGIRPLYFGSNGDSSVAFGSELKSLVGMVSRVQEIRPGTIVSMKNGVQDYLPNHPNVTVPSDAEAAAKALREHLIAATERRLADGAVGGMLLSGGLDSSIIAAIANEIKPGLPAFTVGVEGAPDLANAKTMAEYLGVEHVVKVFGTEEIRRLVPKAVPALESFDEDCVSGAIANMVASKLAGERTNCILSGEGGDELNGGYLLLKDLPDPESRRTAMQNLIDVAYNTALQRLDRAMMTNSMNYRTPFLDSEVTAFCLQMPVNWKVRDVGDGRFVEKWLLREAFRDMLPNVVYEREKLRFSGGTGTDPILESISEELIPKTDFTDEVSQIPAGYTLNSPKELYYYRLFKKHFPDPCFVPLVGRWDPGK